MSDDGVAVAEKKRGRPAKADKAEKDEPVKEAKKRGRPAVEKKEEKKKDDSDAPVVKRGRGRPKGASKKAAAKPKVCTRLILLIT